MARAREQATQYFLTHGGWRFIPPVPAPSPHRSFVGSLVHAVGTGISDAAEWAWHHKAQVVTVTAIVALTVANVAQLGLDPATDAAEAGAIGEEGALIAADGTEDGAAAEEDAAASCGGQSFTASTKVVLADGSAVAMSGLHVGRKVKATDPKTGKTSVRTIDKVWVNHDTDLMDVTVHSKDGVSVVHTTQKHPFWDVTTRAWTDADHLRASDKLMSAAGILVTVARTTTVPGAADMWDLTVDGLHDFYIVTTPAASSNAAGSTDTILVHNCPMSRGAKARVWKQNVEKYDSPTCENCGVEVERPVAPQRGVRTPWNQGEVDHKYPESLGGANTDENGQLLCRSCNLEKSNKWPW